MLKQYVNTDYIDRTPPRATPWVNSARRDDRCLRTSVPALPARRPLPHLRRGDRQPRRLPRPPPPRRLRPPPRRPPHRRQSITNSPSASPPPATKNNKKNQALSGLGFLCWDQRSTRRTTGISAQAPVGQTSTHLRQVAQKVAALSAGTIGLTTVLNPRL